MASSHRVIDGRLHEHMDTTWISPHHLDGFTIFLRRYDLRLLYDLLDDM